MLQIQEMAVTHKHSPLLTIGAMPDMIEPDCDCEWDSSDDVAVGRSSDTPAVNSFRVNHATAPGTGSSTPAADSGSTGDVALGGSRELCPADGDGDLGDVQSNEVAAGCDAEGAWEPDVPAVDVGSHSISASEWEIVSKMSPQEE
jgi:hypothetical protein